MAEPCDITRSFPASRDRYSLKGRVASFLTVSVAAVLLYFVSHYNFELYHTLIELISVVVALTIFSIGWHTRKYATSSMHLIIAIGYLFVGLSDSMHLLFYKGWGMPDSSASMSLMFQLFLLGRLIEALTLLVAVWTLGKNLRLSGPRMLTPTLMAWLLVMLLIVGEKAPETVVKGSGFSPFANSVIALTCLILVTGLILLHGRWAHLRSRVSELIAGSMGLMIVAYVLVPFYGNLGGLVVYASHLLKLLAYVLLYRALVVGALAEPYYTLFLDLTNSELAARRAKTSAENANHDKTSFIARISHEIRTPMNSVIGLSTLLLETDLSPVQRRYASMTRESANVLIALVNQVLEFTKLEEHGMKLSEAPFVLRDVVEGVTEMFALSRPKDGVEISASIAEGTPEVVVGDAFKLRQVLTNLVGNAVKFTERGQIRVSVSAAGGGGERPLFHFAVSDTGRGIPEKDLPRLFMPYEQVEGISQAAQGTGLGLVISKQIVELMGGEVGVRSKEGGGSLFTFTARFGVVDAWIVGLDGGAQELADQNGKARALAGMTALVADDNEINRVVTSAFLQRIGFRVDTAENGKLAVEAARSNQYDVIFMDVRMPVQDGLDATREIRRLGITIPVVGLTAAAFEGDRESCIESGMDLYLTKPVEERLLFEALSRLLAPDSNLEKEERWKRTAEIGFKPLLKRFSSNPAKLGEISAMFLQDCAVHISNLNELIASGEREEAADVAHALRGCFVVFGAVRGGNLSKTLELALRGKENGDCEILMVELGQEMHRIEKYVKSEVERILSENDAEAAAAGANT